MHPAGKHHSRFSSKSEVLCCSVQCHLHAAVEVHAVDTNTRVVLDAEIDVLRDTETKVAGLREVALAKLVLLDLEATLENLLGLWATDSDVDGDLLVTTDTESADGVAGLGVDGGLTRQLLEHLGGTSKSVTRLADGNVQDELLDAQLTHGVGGLVGGALGLDGGAIGLGRRGTVSIGRLCARIATLGVVSRGAIDGGDSPAGWRIRLWPLWW